MAHEVLANPRLFLGGYELTGDTSRVALAGGTEALDDTTFGLTYRRRTPGLRTVALQAEGFWNGDARAIDDAVAASLGVVGGVPVSLLPQPAAEGGRAFTFLANLTEAQLPGGNVGELIRYSLGAEGDGALARGIAMLNRVAQADSASAAINLGPVAAGQRLYLAVHVLAFSGAGAHNIELLSDDAQAFTTSTLRITGAQVTGVGSQFLSVAGPITDSWWVFNYNPTGGTPSVTYVVVAGIA